MTHTGAQSSTNVLLFGASNLTLGWTPLLQQLLRTIRQPANVHVCLGMGRSWLTRSRYFARTLPAILDCGLWNNLPAAQPTDCVLITDIGNDIVYRYRPPQIRQAVDETLRRIRAWNPAARIAMTLPPLVSLQRLHPLHFRIARTLLFPLSRLTFPDVLQAAAHLQDLLLELEGTDGLQLIPPQREWYGADPIHLRRSMRAAAFQTYFAGWGQAPCNAANGDSANGRQPPGLPEPILLPQIPLPVAAERTVFGRSVQTAQPVIQTASVAVSAW